MTASRTSAMPSMVAGLRVLAHPQVALDRVDVDDASRPPAARCESSRPISVPLLNVMPNGTIIRTASASEVGSVIIAMSVPRHSPRKSSTAMPVSRMAMPSSCQTLSNRMLTKCALS